MKPQTNNEQIQANLGYDDEPIGLTEIEWSRRQRKDLAIGFTFLGGVVAFIVGVTVWFCVGSSYAK